MYSELNSVHPEGSPRAESCKVWPCLAITGCNDSESVSCASIGHLAFEPCPRVKFCGLGASSTERDNLTVPWHLHRFDTAFVMWDASITPTSANTGQ
eukprot:5770103-Amphidinium_carterae.1